MCVCVCGTPRILKCVADLDVGIYSGAVHLQALLLQAGRLDLDLFGPVMKTLLKQVGVCLLHGCR
jgi:hypothetical protein